MSKLIKFILMMLLIVTYIWTTKRNLELPRHKYKSETYDVLVMITTLITFIHLLYTV